ncbi:Gfo/Idh/MocA family protein [Gordoniibacillus kamchatkensis]|uniref:Gfo/Idh/MocA family protein n=1 Tax=Gordoniibacillus kamchatkensis TaxID=1590651 RepID=UPI000AC328AF
MYIMRSKFEISSYKMVAICYNSNRTIFQSCCGGVTYESTFALGRCRCAQIAFRSFIPAVKQSQFGEVAAIASRDREKARTAAETHGIAKHYGSYAELLADPDIDAVYIPLPNHLHREWTIRAARAGKHVLCEKPMSLSERHAVQMVEACEQFGVKLQESFVYRYHPRYDRVREIVASGELGDIRAMHGTYTFNKSAVAQDVRFSREMGGGGLYDVGCYLISAARYVLGQEPVAATVQALFSPQYDDVDMMASGLLEFPNSVGFTFQCGMWAEFTNRLEIRGTDGLIVLPSAFTLRDPLNPNLLVTVRGETREEPMERLNQFALEVDRFARTILFGEPEPFDPWDSVRNMKALEACLTSAREGKRIVIEQ